MKFLITVLLLVKSISAASVAKKCDAVDLVFVVDSSNSIWPVNHDRHIKPFIKDVVSIFKVGPGSRDSRVGLVTFSNDYHLQFHLNSHLAPEALDRAIDNMRFPGGDTHTYKALQYATETMFTKNHGDRSDIQDVMIILTDGASNNSPLTRAAAKEAKSRGIRVFAIGVGSAVNFDELVDVASLPSETYVFKITDYSSLSDIRENFNGKDCGVFTTTIKPVPTTTDAKTTSTKAPSTTRPTTISSTPTSTTTRKPTTTTKQTTTKASTTTRSTTTTKAATTTMQTTTTIASTTTTLSTTTVKPPLPSVPPKTNDGFQDSDRNISYCGGKPADIFFILDSSNSVYKDDFHDRTLGFVRDIVSSFDIGPNKTRVGMVTYSDKVESNFGLKAHQDKESLMNAIQPEYIRYIGGQTHTGDAIRFVRTTGYKVGGSARAGAARIIIVITDGISQDPDYTKREAQAARDIGAYIFAVGVGRYVDNQELNDIASNPDKDFVFTVDNYGALRTIRNLIPRKACDAISTPVPLNPTKIPEFKKCPSTQVHFIYESGTKSLIERKKIVEVMWRFSNDKNNAALPIKVGVTTDPCTSSKRIPFSDIDNFRQNIQELKSSQTVSLHSLVRRVRRQYRSVSPDTAKIMVIFVDENSTDLRRLYAESRYAQFRGFKVMIVAVGSVDEKYLMRMVSKPTDKFYQRVNRYDELDYLNIRASHLVCEINGKTTSTGETTIRPTTSQRTKTIATRRPAVKIPSKRLIPIRQPM